MKLFETEEALINAIQNGDIESIKDMKLTPADINRRLFLHHRIPVVNQSEHYFFPELIDPTSVTYAIACEQVDILDYFIENLSPDFSIPCNGWYPIHFAAYCQDPMILRLLLKFEYVQQNIDIPIIETQENSFGHKTTALHIAVSNQRHGQVIMLTQDLPVIKFNIYSKRILEKDSPVSDDSSMQSANAAQLATSGNSSLHIAAYKNDWDMCQILLNAYSENQILNTREQTPCEVARSRGFEELAQKIDEMDILPIEELQQKYLSDIMFTFERGSKEPATREAVEKLKETVEQLEEIARNIADKISTIEKSKEL
jgi:ankyrin repeat protein